MLEKSKRELMDAQRYSAAMMRSLSFDDFEIAWRNFLESVYKVFHKAENEIIRTILDENIRNKFLSKYKRELKKDPLLSYLFQVRGVSIHTISEIASEESGITVVPILQSQGIFINELIIENGLIKKADMVNGELLYYKKPILIEVINRGVVYPVPVQHFNEGINSNPFEISLLAIKYYDEFLKETEVFIAHNV